MDAPNQPTKAHVVHDEQDALVGFVRRWLVVERKQNARDALNDKQGKGDCPPFFYPFFCPLYFGETSIFISLLTESSLCDNWNASL